MVVGRSGSGKSSLVYAGLMPALRRERDQFWNVLSLRPGPAPLRALAAAFNPRADDEGAAEYQTKITREADNLRTGDPEFLSHMIRDELDRAQGKPDRLLLYVDQWEELYAQAPSSADKERAAQPAADVNRFIDLLLTAARTAPVAVVGSVRADFFDPLIAHQELRSLLPTRQVLLGSMPRSELERTIVEPARKVGLSFDPPGLVQRILDDAGDDDGMLPLLQYALKETWALRKDAAMTGDAYARCGGVREAIRVTAERAFAALSSPDQQAARRLFLRLVTPGEGQEDTRAQDEFGIRVVRALGFMAANKEARIHWMQDPDAGAVVREDAQRSLAKVLAHRVRTDLRRGWRYTNPSLSVLKLIDVAFIGLDDIAEDAGQFTAILPKLGELDVAARRAMLRKLLGAMLEGMAVHTEALDLTVLDSVAARLTRVAWRGLSWRSPTSFAPMGRRGGRPTPVT